MPGVARLRTSFRGCGERGSWNRPGLNRLKAALQPGYCVKVAALDRLGWPLTDVLDLLGWLRAKQVEIVGLREFIDQDSALGRAMLDLAITFAEMERDLIRERTLAKLERVKVTASASGGARRSAGSVPRKSRTCAGETVFRGAALPR